jgi:hypothetical protein
MYKNLRPNYVTPLTTSMILEVSIHVQDNYGEKDLEYGSHSRIHETSSPPEIIGVLESEFKAQRGKIIVSGKSCLSIFDQLTDYIKFVRIMLWPTQPVCTSNGGWTSG